MGKRIIVTGGSGKTGKYVIDHLLQKGHQVLNLDLAPLTVDWARQAHTLKVDLTDSGQVYSALGSHFRLTEPFREQTNQVADGIIHLAGYARNMVVPDNETFRGNALGAYNIIESSCRLGIKKIILASSVCVYGVTFAEGDADFPSFPVDEKIDVNPTDAYSISKVCVERIARGFARKFNADIYVLRIGAVVAPEDYGERFENYVEDPDNWKVHGWSYTDARDLGQICELGVRKDGLGFQIFNATNDEITNRNSTVEYLKQQCPETPHTRPMGVREAPMSNRKVRELLGFREEHHWMRYYPKDIGI